LDIAEFDMRAAGITRADKPGEQSGLREIVAPEKGL
jgi:hypothetical protein